VVNDVYLELLSTRSGLEVKEQIDERIGYNQRVRTDYIASEKS
jgi:hypothetical protein